MSMVFQKLNEYLAQQKTVMKQPDSILQFLEDAYLEANPVSGGAIREIEKKMAPFYESIPFEQSNTLFQMVYDLCGQYERAAFRCGLQVGLRLWGEIEQM